MTHTVGSTIAAIATGSGGGVGIIRLSGPAAETIGRRVCRPWPEQITSHHLYLGQALGPPAADTGEPEVIDQVLFCLMRAPRSYTGEDVVEIHGHGGAVNLQRLLEACYQAGASAAQPGEFTRRAFLAGKLDLTRAEAVAALVSAQSVQAARQAQRQLHGELGQIAAELRREAVALLGEFEGILDFPDAEVDAEIFRQAQGKLSALLKRVSSLTVSFAQGGRALQSGLEIAVLGRPNVGKSSLINALCGSERVLVDESPGTTRDYVEVQVQWGGLPVTLIDTAGERAEASRLELQGMRLGRERWRNADLCLLVVDGTVGLGAEEEQLLASIPESIARLVVWNKMDHAACSAPAAGAIACSALCGWRLEEVRQAAVHRAAARLPLSEGAELLVTSARQAAVLQQANGALYSAEAALERGEAVELIAAELRVAAARLGELTGQEVSSHVIDEIFARFCVGK
ncbi:MAG TPA: tRNA uridine-5-carboxymethylaminomethyl(34) synthesis GTPase MnmE [Pseudomonadota bacterium]|nr:tRNA uridine-5-carboxymethylaminomethyl(34) synthesis GTPase MnmE [Pseudomonadota bacterium]